MTDWVDLKYFKNNTLFVFDEYEIHSDSTIRRKNDGILLNKYFQKNKLTGEGYYKVNITHKGKRDSLTVSICVLSSFIGVPPTDGKRYTADHKISENKYDDSLTNLRWADGSTQRLNQRKSERDFNKIDICRIDSKGIVVIYTGIKEAADKNNTSTVSIGKWLKGAPCVRIKDAYGGRYTWSYREEQDDLPDEIWHETIPDSRVFGSQFGRIKDERKTSITKRYPKEYISSMTTLQYPMLTITGRHYTIHYLIYIAWFPFSGDYKEYDYKICHKNDDPYDCSISNLRVDTRSANGKDAHRNGSYDKSSSRKKPVVGICIKTNKREEFDSVHEAARFIGKKRAQTNIWICLTNYNNRKNPSAYGYFWEYM